MAQQYSTPSDDACRRVQLFSPGGVVMARLIGTPFIFNHQLLLVLSQLARIHSLNRTGTPPVKLLK
jgi:hypothetical protein